MCDTATPVGPAVRLNWTTASGAASYDVYRNGSQIFSGVTGTTFYNNAGLTAGQTYTYFVRARNSAGTTDSNTVSVFIPSNICAGSTVPGSFSLSNQAPVCDTATPVGPAVRLNWTTASGAASYDVYRNGSQIFSGVTGTTFYNNAGLTAGQTYTYYVRARNSAGTTDSNTVSVFIPSNICAGSTAPGSFSLSNQAPVCDTATPVGPAVRLNWTTASGAASYDIYRNGSQTSSGITGTTFYNNARLTAGQTYTYFVRARNSAGTTDSNLVRVFLPSDICGAAPSLTTTLLRRISRPRNSFAENSVAIRDLRAPERHNLKALGSGPQELKINSSASGVQIIAPDSLASAFGPALSESTHTTEWAIDQGFPPEADGIRIEVNGRTAQLLFVSPSQINFLVPIETELGIATVVVRRSDGAAIAEGRVEVQASAPGAFELDTIRPTQGAIINAVTGELEPFSVGSLDSGEATRLSIFGTGWRFAGGKTYQGAARNIADLVHVAAHSESREWTLQVEYAGPAPGIHGLDQINVVLPEEMDAAGKVWITITAGGGTSQPVSAIVASRVGPSIDNFFPSAAPPGAEIVITGGGFAAEPTQNTILYRSSSGKEVAIVPLSATTTSVSATVPLINDTYSSETAQVCLVVHGKISCSNHTMQVLAPRLSEQPPGQLLLQGVADANRRTVNRLRDAGLTEMASLLDEISNDAAAVLRDVVTNAVAGTPVLAIPGDRATAIDVQTLRKLEALLAAAPKSAVSKTNTVTFRPVASQSDPACPLPGEVGLHRNKGLRDAWAETHDFIDRLDDGLLAGALTVCVAARGAQPLCEPSMRL